MAQETQRSFKNIKATGKNLNAGSTRHLYALEYPEPLVHFALCSGACSDPEVRAYTAESVFQDLKLAQTEFIQDSVWCKETKDTSLGMLGLVEEINECLLDIQKKALRSCMQGNLDKAYIGYLKVQPFGT